MRAATGRSSGSSGSTRADSSGSSEGSEAAPERHDVRVKNLRIREAISTLAGLARRRCAPSGMPEGLGGALVLPELRARDGLKAREARGG